jgi:hypothetical protein
MALIACAAIAVFLTWYLPCPFRGYDDLYQMKKYIVEVEIEGRITVGVLAENQFDAIEKASSGVEVNYKSSLPVQSSSIGKNVSIADRKDE